MRELSEEERLTDSEDEALAKRELKQLARDAASSAGRSWVGDGHAAERVVDVLARAWG